MRLVLALAIVPALLAGCADRIPYKDVFGISALRATGDIPPEFAEFNHYDPQIDALLANQICAQPYIRLEERSLPAAPGEIVAWRGRCEPYELPLDRLDGYFTP